MAIVMQKYRATGKERESYAETTYEGAVLEVYEVNGYHDSDFYAIVWDEAEGSVKHIEYGTTRFWTYNNGASVDATEEVRAKAAASRAASYGEELRGAWKAEAAEVTKGSTVRFKRAFNGRKQGRVEEGTEGEVIWRGPDRYGGLDRAGVAIEGREEPIWIGIDALEVSDPEPIDEEAIALAIERKEAKLREGGTFRSWPILSEKIIKALKAWKEE